MMFHRVPSCSMYWLKGSCEIVTTFILKLVSWYNKFCGSWKGTYEIAARVSCDNDNVRYMGENPDRWHRGILGKMGSHGNSPRRNYSKKKIPCAGSWQTLPSTWRRSLLSESRSLTARPPLTPPTKTSQCTGTRYHAPDRITRTSYRTRSGEFPIFTMTISSGITKTWQRRLSVRQSVS